MSSPRSHFSSSSSQSMLKQRTACEFKKNLVEERVMDLTNQKKNGDSVSKDRPIICSPMDRAQAIQANLPPHFPSFLKPMQISHVTARFRLRLPKLFCDAHLPKQDGTIVLVDDSDRRYNTKYLVERNGLSVGWRSFSTENKLLEGDVLVFQLIEPCMFKIYIAKATILTQVDAAATTLPYQNHFHHEQIEAVKTEPGEEKRDVTETTGDKYLEYLAPETEKLIPVRKSAKRPSEYCLLSFKDVKGFKDFSIYVDDGIVIESAIPTQCKAKYYELCKSQNMFLHENLIRGLSNKFAADMISETIVIADAIRAVDFNTGVDRMEGWDKTLKAFEDLGMAVGFLRVRIQELLGVCREYGADIDLKRIEREEAEEEMRARIAKIDAEIDALSAKNEGLCPVLKEIACSPW